MIRRVWIAYQVELVKALRLKSTYLGLGLVTVAVLCAPLLHPIRRDAESDYAFISLVTPATLDLLGLLLLLAYCAGLVSSEVGSGTIRLVVVRPLRRVEFLTAKLMIGATYAVALTVLVGGLSWGLVYAFGDADGVVFGGELLYTGREVLAAYVLGALLALAPLVAAAAYAVMISTLTRSTGAAISAAIGIWLLVDTIKYPLGIAPYVFTTYFDTPWQVFQTEVTDAMPVSWFPTAGYCLGTSFAYGLVFVVVAMLVFHRRNL